MVKAILIPVMALGVGLLSAQPVIDGAATAEAAWGSPKVIADGSSGGQFNVLRFYVTHDATYMYFGLSLTCARNDLYNAECAIAINTTNGAGSNTWPDYIGYGVKPSSSFPEAPDYYVITQFSQAYVCKWTGSTWTVVSILYTYEGNFAYTETAGIVERMIEFRLELAAIDGNVNGDASASMYTYGVGGIRIDGAPDAADTYAASVLPVQLTAFSVSSSANDAKIDWSTTTELNCARFDIERRNALSGDAWQTIASVPGGGTSSVPRTYSHTDRGLSYGRYAYRLKQVDHDGYSEYFHAAEIEVGVAAKELFLGENYPNPFNPTTTIRFSVPVDGHATLKVMNLIGQVVAKPFSDLAQAGRYYDVRIDAHGYPSGMYLYTLETAGSRQVRRMVLMK